MLCKSINDLKKINHQFCYFHSNYMIVSTTRIFLKKQTIFIDSTNILCFQKHFYNLMMPCGVLTTKEMLVEEISISYTLML